MHETSIRERAASPRDMREVVALTLAFLRGGRAEARNRAVLGRMLPAPPDTAMPAGAAAGRPGDGRGLRGAARQWFAVERASDLVRLVCSQARVDLAMARSLRRLLDIDGVAQLGYARFADYSRDRLGMTSRWARELIALDRGVQGFPVLSSALNEGRLSTAKVLAVLPLVTAANEAEWVEKARVLTVRALEMEVELARRRGDLPRDAAKGAGTRAGAAGAAAESLEAEGAGRSADEVGAWVQLRAPAAVAHLYDYAIEIARRAMGSQAPVHRCVEHILAEFVAAFPQAVSAGGTGPAQAAAEDRAEPVGDIPSAADGTHESHETYESHTTHETHETHDMPKTQETDEAASNGHDDLRAIRYRILAQIAHREWESEASSARVSGPPWRLDPALDANAVPPTPIALDRHLRQLVRLRQMWHSEMGRQLRILHERRLWREIGFSDLDHFCREKLGISRRLAYELMATDRALERLPKIRDACSGGRLGWEKARLLATIARRDTEEAWLERARRVTVRYLELEVTRSRRERETNLAGWSLDGRPSPLCHVSPYSVHSPVRPGAALVAAARPTPTSSPAGPLATPAAEAAVHMSSLATAPDGPGVHTSSPAPAGVHMSSTAAPLGATRVHTYSIAGSAWYPECPDRSHDLPCVIRFWLPDATLRLWRLVDAGIARLAATNASSAGNAGTHGTGKPAAPWQRLLALLEHFLRTWDEADRRQYASAYRAFSRDGWVCTVPGCLARRGLERHHIIFRSQEGADDLFNLTVMCAAHHRHSLHDRGSVRCTGDAPYGLVWQLPVGTFRGDVRQAIPTT